jgi:uncharacterized UPF0146 family protein
MHRPRETSFKSFRQPNDALNPTAFSVGAAEKWAIKKSWNLPAEPFRLTAFWHIDFIRQPVPQERKTRYTVRLAQSENYGLACGLTPALAEPNPDFVGKDVRQILKDRLCRDYIDRTAFVDLVMGHVSGPASQHITLEGTPLDKYLDRSRVFANEAEKIFQRKGFKNLKGNRPRILVIGATAAVIVALIRRGFEVSATDLYPALVGTELGGVKICNGRVANASLMRKADLAIITGMTLPNRTLPGLMKLAKKYNTSTMIWAITGKNFGHYYIEHGADCVISDPSPFLLLPGPATFAICRRKN